jgi:hypothetical protein
MTRSVVLLTFTLGLLMPRPAAAGPWTKNLGQAYVKLNESLFFSNSFVNAQGVVEPGADYLGATTSVYFEVGVWKGLQVQGLLPYTIGTNTDGEDGTRQRARRAGGGDLLLGLQYSPPLGDLGLKLATRLEIKVPMYDVNQQPTGITTLDNLFPALGDGQVDVTFWLVAGGSLPGPFYAWGEVGYRFRTEAFVGDGPTDGRTFEDSVAWLGQLGWTFYGRMILIANFIGVLSLAGERDVYTKSYITVGPGLYIPVWKGLALEANFDPIVYAKNSAPGFSLGFGVSYSR